ncbi:MAG: hypothetical protein V4555_13425 [Acidobacteriota bacterium]
MGRSIAVTAALLPGSVSGTAVGGGGTGEGRAQQTPKPPTAVIKPHSSFPEDELDVRTGDPTMARMQAVRARELREDRHRRLVLDTTRLVQVSYEVHRNVVNAGEDGLPEDLAVRLLEIEKLAHDVGQRMKN